MNLHSLEFERRLRKHIRPSWKKARKRHGRVGISIWERRWQLPPVGLELLAVMFFSALARSDWPVTASGPLFALLLSGFILVCRENLGTVIERSPALPILAWLPASKHLIFEHGWRRITHFGWHHFLVISIALTAFAAKSGAGTDAFLKVIPVAILGAVAAVALTVLPIPIARRYVLVLLLGIGAAASFDIPFLAPVLRESLMRCGPTLNWLHPGGWIVLLWQGSLSFHDWGLLAAAPLLVLSAAIPLIRSYWLQEFDAGWKLPPLGEPAEADERPTPAEPSGKPRAVTLKEIRSDLRSNASTPGPIARWTISRLSKRECMLMETLGKPLPNHANKCRNACLIYSVILSMAWSVELLDVINPLFVYLLYMGAFVVGLATFFLTLPLTSVLRCEYAALRSLPIGYREIAWMEWKIAWPGFLFMTIPNVLLGAGLGFLTGDQEGAGALTGAKLSAGLTALFPLVITGRFSHATNDTTGWRWIPFLISSGICLSTLMAFATFVALFIPGWNSWLIMCAAAACWAALFAIHSNAWARRKFDLLASPTPLPESLAPRQKARRQ